jgi:pimeloyl-ACP methyl ester carboxylesterase
MNDVKTEEMTIPVPGGYVFVKTWIPDQNIAQAPLILLHDSLGSVAQWRDFPVYLAKQLSRKVIAYDRLGFGKSSSREMLPSIDFVSEESEIYFPYIKEGLSIKKFVLMGHSVGGGMAINIAANDTDCLGVATISAQAFVEEMTLRGITQAKEMFSNPEQVAKLEKWHGEKAGWVLRAWTDCIFR